MARHLKASNHPCKKGRLLKMEIERGYFWMIRAPDACGKKGRLLKMEIERMAHG